MGTRLESLGVHLDAPGVVLHDELVLLLDCLDARVEHLGDTSELCRDLIGRVHFLEASLIKAEEVLQERAFSDLRIHLGQG